MRILVDYRPALRARTGVGEYVHEMVRALGPSGDPTAPDSIALFSSSWKDRLAPAAVADLGHVSIVDRRIPGRVLAALWNRLEWPAIESLAGPCDVVHSATPLLIPARHAAQLVTIHDLHFLRHPERMRAEMRRDFPALVEVHARRAHGIVVSSRHTEQDVATTLGVPPERVHYCPASPAAWALAVADIRPARPRRHILFVGTLDPRKNLGVLLDAYAGLRSRLPDAPPLVLAGGLPPSARAWIDRTRTTPLAGHVDVTGYVTEARRRELFADAHMLVLPSFDEGFGLPVLEAMAAGVPVVISSGGSLPEVAGDAATPLDPADTEGFARTMASLLNVETARLAAELGRQRAATFSRDASAGAVRCAYRAAVARR